MNLVACACACGVAVLFVSAAAPAQGRAAAGHPAVAADARGGQAAGVEPDDAGWQVAAEILSATPAVTGDGFGSACAMNEDGTVLVVGASDSSVNGSAAVGSIHIYKFSVVDGLVGSWRHFQKIDCPPFVSPSGASQTPPGLSLFGWSVAMSGTTIVVGAPVVTPTNGPAFAGRVYVFQLDDGDGLWGRSVTVDGEEFRVAHNILAPSDPEMIGYFGGSVAVDVAKGSTRIAVGSPFRGAANQGGVYLYEALDSTFTQKRFLIPEDVVGQDNFGSKVAINGSLLVVGAQNADSDDVINSGAAYIYRRGADGVWPTGFEARLLPANGARDDGFGSSVAVLGTTVAVGAPGTDRASAAGALSTNNGSAYIYGYEAGQWVQQAEIYPREENGSNAFGFSVSLATNGTTLLVGSPGYDTTLVNAGTGFTYYCTGEVDCAWEIGASDLWTTAAGTSQAIGEQAVISRDGTRAVLGSRNNATPALLTNKMFSWGYSADPLPDRPPVGTPPTAQSPGADGIAPGTPSTGTPPGGSTPSTGGFGGVGSAPIPATPTVLEWGVVRASVIAVDRHAARIMIIMTDGNGALETAGKSMTFLGSYDPTWEVLGLGDVDGDGSSDVLFHVPATRKVKAWIRLGSRIVETVTVGTTSPGDRFIGISDWTNNGFDGPAFLHADGVNAVFWVVQGGAVTSQIDWALPDGEWSFRMCDVNADDRADIIAHNAVTDDLVKVVPKATGADLVDIPRPGKSYVFASAQDFDKDGTTDFLWENRDTGLLEFVFPNSDGSSRFRIPWDSNLHGWRIDPGANFTTGAGTGVIFSKGGAEVLVLTVRFEPLETLPAGRGNIRVDYSRVIGELGDGYTILGPADEP